jgi:hypothetical protein
MSHSHKIVFSNKVRRSTILHSFCVTATMPDLQIRKQEVFQVAHKVLADGIMIRDAVWSSLCEAEIGNPQ